MLLNIQTQSQVIIYAGCITQMFFVLLFSGLDNFLLTVMSYDWYVTICRPLLYTVIMNPQLCVLLVLTAWNVSALHSLLHTLMILQLSFCPHVEIPQFYYDLNKLVHLACSDTFLNVMVTYSAAVLLGGGPIAGIIYSYSKIVSSFCAISSAQRKYKAFSAYASHLSVVSLIFCTSMGVYLSAAATHSSQSSAAVSVIYTVVTPMLNAFIYSLRNKNAKRALKNSLWRKTLHGPIVLELTKFTNCRVQNISKVL
ncbi:olfactory receptor 7A10-like [Tupaia chinensis]|uniref:olfactory receptor 7A10-like n=1 Tax=Tupaia chinensis TaxID=246437 RepID=UPI000FFC314F|nr:olfactory receptor 7A10-like [Tupaia chinensis]